MKLPMLLALTVFFSLCQSANKPLIANLATAKWDKDDSVTLREDSTTTEYLVRKPAGYAFNPHMHSVDERIVLLEGRLSVQVAGGPEEMVDPGGYAFLPAKQAQRLKCVSNTRCTFYIRWDGKLDFLPAPK